MLVSMKLLVPQLLPVNFAVVNMGWLQIAGALDLSGDPDFHNVLGLCPD